MTTFSKRAAKAERAAEREAAQMTDITTMADEIYALVCQTRSVTFTELDRRIKGFTGGNSTIFDSEYANVLLWIGLTDTAADALEQLLNSEKIYPVPTPCLTYLDEGDALSLPLATSHRHYKKPHWFPVVLNPGPPPESAD